MKRNISVLIVLVLSLVFCSLGCKRKVPTQDYGNANIGSYGNVTANQMSDAIIRGGSSIGWQMNSVSPGLITATKATRGHSLTMNIEYTAKDYTIKYRDSVNMDAKDGKIHRNYNRWVERLNQNISAEVSKIKK